MRNQRKARNNKRRQPKQNLEGRVSSLTEGAGKMASRLGPLLVLALVAVGLPAMIYQGYIYTISSPSFAISSIEVEGVQSASKLELLKASKLAPGINIFSVDELLIQQRIESHPWVQSAKVSRSLPSGVSITVQEHTPAALVAVEGGFALVDAKGKRFKMLEQTDPHTTLFATLPLITGISTKVLDEGKDASSQGPVVQAIGLWKMVQEQGESAMGSLSEVHWDPVLGFSLIVGEEGTEVRLGRGRLDERLKRLKRVYEKLDQGDIAVDYVLIDQDGDLDRVAVGPRVKQQVH